MKTSKLISGTFPRDLAGVVMGYAIAPPGSCPRAVGIYGCFEQCEQVASDKCVTGAAQVGLMAIVLRLLELGASSDAAFIGAVYGAQHDIIRTAVAHGAASFSQAMAIAGKRNDHMTIRLLAELGATPHDATIGLVNAMHHGNLAAAQELIHMSPDRSAGLAEACYSNRPDMVRFMLEHNAEWGSVGINASLMLRVGSEVARMMLVAGQWTRNICGLVAAQCDDVLLLHDLEDQGFTPQLEHARHAGRFGALAALKMIVNWAPGYAKAALLGACKTGQLAAIALAIELGATVSDKCIRIASANGHVDAVRDLLVRLPKPVVAFATAIATSQLRVIQYIMKRYPPTTPRAIDTFFGLTCSGNGMIQNRRIVIARYFQSLGAVVCTHCALPVAAHFKDDPKN